MKKFDLVLLLFLIAGLFTANQADAQALVLHGETHTLMDPDGNVYESTETLELVTPSGNVLVKETFRLPPEMFEWITGVWVFGPLTNFTTIDGVEYYLEDWKAHFYRSGKVVVILHLNGSGNVTPGNGNANPS